MKIYIVAAIHGDELLGLKVVGRINRTGKNQILVRVGHPAAVAKHKRYLEEDLNRSFASKKDTIEAFIARDIKLEINKFNPDLVIDIHTSVTDTGRVAIVAKDNQLISYVAQALGMEKVVIMPKQLIDTSLIGLLPDISISLEFGINNRSDKLASEISTRIESLNISDLNLGTKLPTFEVYSQIDKNFSKLHAIKNLVFNEELGGYPFLAGLNTYKTIGGFLAKKIS